MDKSLIRETAEYIYKAQTELFDIPKLTNEKLPNLTFDEAYVIQEEVIKIYEENGHKVLAPKMGLTSKAKWEQMGVDSPCYGYIFESSLEEGDTIKMSDYIHPKVEPEIGIVLKNDIGGSDLTVEDVLANIDYVFSCVEVIDSRYENFNFTLVDVIADNTSAAGAVFSKEKYTDEIDLAAEKVTLKINGEVQEEGDGTAVLGHPAEAIVSLAKLLDEKGQVVKAGQPIMTGGMTGAVLINEGDLVEVTYSNLEAITIKVEA